MKLSIINKINICGIVAFIFNASCAPQNDSFLTVENIDIINGIKNYNFNYRAHEPGPFLNYRHLWQGYNEGYDDFALSISKRERLFTYEVSFSEDKNYYFAYLPQNVVQRLDGNINLNVFENDKDFKICDGKYISLFQNSFFFNRTSIEVYSSEYLSDAKFKVNSMILVGIFKRNIMNVTLNISTKTKMESTITLLKIIPKNLNNIDKTFTFKNEDAKRTEEDSYSYFMSQNNGKYIYNSLNSIENETYFSYPYLTFEKYGIYLNNSIKIETINNKEIIKLKRYTKIDGEEIDMLEHPEISYSPLEEVYIGLQEKFKKALLKDTENDYAYFLYDEIKYIIS